ncbi:phosphoribosyltransferase [Microbacterium sulfonylureivorans]|uniref:phosphoribosyltransferase n=1 Tax=Microbacterium sulfonylureivorans TaxID=2486854 RepID=UPI000FDA2F03|nr:phosphoribosyltransferase family protein [Microbacterium sulfonylureivorans]
MNEIFRDRSEAGRRLAARLADLRAEDVVVLGLPRGGVPVAAEVAAALGAPLDVIVVRKLGVPFQQEVAMGAIGEDGTRLLDLDLISRLGITSAQVHAVEQKERDTLEARIALLRAVRDRVDLTGRTAVVVDDGIATGATASVACQVARALGAHRVIVAAPVGGQDAGRRVQGADEVICLVQPPAFQGVGAHYQDFGPTSEAEVVDLLEAARRRVAGAR